MGMLKSTRGFCASIIVLIYTCFYSVYVGATDEEYDLL